MPTSPPPLRYSSLLGSRMSANLKEITRPEKVPYSTIAGWVGRGLIEPSHRSGRSGAAIRLDDKNVIELKNLIRLRKGGLLLQRA
jgi:hypothetical protein